MSVEGNDGTNHVGNYATLFGLKLVGSYEVFSLFSTILLNNKQKLLCPSPKNKDKKKTTAFCINTQDGTADNGTISVP